MSPDYDTHDADVVVVGAGGAGLRAAIAARQAGARVLLVCKSLLGKAHTVMAEGGAAAALGNVDPEDSWKAHFADTMRGGGMINNWRMAELFAKEAPERILELERFGAVFDRTKDGLINQRPFGAHSYRRLAHVGDRTGLELVRTLQDRAVALGVDVLMEYTFTRILKDGDKVAGIFGYRREDGREILVRAKAIVLATGGWGKLYQVTSNSWESTGDGCAMAYEAGAELLDMEMVQFHPTGMVWPPGVKGILVTEAVRGEGGVLRNAKGERFMEKYDPVKMELSSRDVVARSIYKEVEAGRGTPHGGAFLDVTHRGAEHIKKKLPSMYEQFHKLADIDITKEAMEVAPTIHYAMGGIKTTAETCASTLPGLFAAGEVSGGLHGANRLGGNSLSDLVVFGARAGFYAAEYAKTQTEMPKIDPAQVENEQEVLERPFKNPGVGNPYLVMEDLQKAMQAGAGIARTEEGLKKCLEKVLEIQDRARRVHVDGTRAYNPSWNTARDILFMTKLAEAIVRCAIERRESRGGHWRLDHLERDEAMGKVNMVAFKQPDGSMGVKQIPRPPMPEHLVQALEASKPPEYKAIMQKEGVAR